MRRVSPGSVSSRARRAVSVAVPLLLGSLLAGHLLMDGYARQVDRVDAALRASVAKAVVPTGAAIRDQLSQAAAGAPAGAVTVPVADGSTTGPSLDTRTAARDGGAPVLEEGAGAATVVAPVFRPGAPTVTTGDRRAALTGFRVTPL